MVVDEVIRPRVDQTTFHGPDEKGNCLQACVATLFGVPLDAVWDLREGPSRHQGSILQRWLDQYGWTYARIVGVRPHHGFYIATGFVARNAAPHAVVMCDGRLYHDPHPSRAGLDQIVGTILFYPKLPSLNSEG